MDAIVVRNLFKSFKEVKAVKGIDLTIEQGEFVAVLGPNGAGKTTLVEMIEGIQTPDEGAISILGKDWENQRNELNKIMGISFQETRFIDKLRVRETLKMFATFYDLPDTRVDEVLAMINLESKSRAFSVNLSGGQRQRMALGIALLNNPEILLLDEPTTGLDPTARREVWDILLSLKNEKTTMILTTHYMEEASYLCDRIVIMDQGKVLARGSLDELLKKHLNGEIIEFTTVEQVEESTFGSNLGLIKATFLPESGAWRLVVEDLVDYLPYLQEKLKQEGHTMSSLECRKMTLDDLFINMTGRRLDD
jgi:ABC-2 type transport system ATP-binding protein